ncbi:MAG: hypothetical protein WD229_07265 [Pirellulales bacterium]
MANNPGGADPPGAEWPLHAIFYQESTAVNIRHSFDGIAMFRGFKQLLF